VSYVFSSSIYTLGTPKHFDTTIAKAIADFKNRVLAPIIKIEIARFRKRYFGFMPWLLLWLWLKRESVPGMAI
jgi:hypothetical protein